MKRNDFIAELEFLSSEKGGRNTPAQSGYRPHIVFDNYPEYTTSGRQNYIDQAHAEPGAKVKAEIAIIATEYFAKRLYENLGFKFCEGPHTIGFGRIISFINSDLKSEMNIDHKTINLNLYPRDILSRIESDFGKDSSQAKVLLQQFLISNENCRSVSFVRALVFLGEKDVARLKQMIELSRDDWKGVLSLAKHGLSKDQHWDFSNEFEKE